MQFALLALLYFFGGLSSPVRETAVLTIGTLIWVASIERRLQEIERAKK